MSIKFLTIYKILLLIFVTTFNNIYADVNKTLAQLNPIFPELTENNINKSVINGFYEVLIENPIYTIIYISTDGRFIIDGDIINLENMSILSDKKLNAIKKDLINSIKEEDKIIFKAKEQKYIINVFTDVDCPYCIKLHSDIEKINNFGISVHYLAYPINKIHPEAEKNMQRIWCAEDKKQAMHSYKTKRIIINNKYCENPIAEQLIIGKKLDIHGTPYIFLEDGSHIVGYPGIEILLNKVVEAFEN